MPLFRPLYIKEKVFSVQRSVGFDESHNHMNGSMHLDPGEKMGVFVFKKGGSA